MDFLLLPPISLPNISKTAEPNQDVIVSGIPMKLYTPVSDKNNLALVVFKGKIALLQISPPMLPDGATILKNSDIPDQIFPLGLPKKEDWNTFQDLVRDGAEMYLGEPISPEEKDYRLVYESVYKNYPI